VGVGYSLDDPVEAEHDQDTQQCLSSEISEAKGGAWLGRAAVWNLTSGLGEFDISFRPSGTEGHDDLVRDAIRLDVRGQQMPVASLADVIRPKRPLGGRRT